jgi:hypothetical protein
VLRSFQFKEQQLVVNVEDEDITFTCQMQNP